MLTKQERRNLVISVVGSLLVAGLVGVVRPLRAFLFGPTAFLPIYAIFLLLAAALPILIYLRRKLRTTQNSLAGLAQEIRGLETQLQAVSSDGDRQIADIHAAESPAKVPEEPKWKSYTTDSFLDVNWKWGWDGTSITNLQPICPKCRLNLHPATELFGEPGDPDAELLLMGLTCHDSDCAFKVSLYGKHHIQTADDLKRHAKDRIIRSAREQGFPE
jgi:hypothetical protein